MFSLCKNFIKINEDLFRVIRVIREEQAKDVELLKVWFSASAVYKKDDRLYFCEKVEDLEILN